MSYNNQRNYNNNNNNNNRQGNNPPYNRYNNNNNQFNNNQYNDYNNQYQDQASGGNYQLHGQYNNNQYNRYSGPKRKFDGNYQGGGGGGGGGGGYQNNYNFNRFNNKRPNFKTVGNEEFDVIKYYQKSMLDDPWYYLGRKFRVLFYY